MVNLGDGKEDRIGSHHSGVYKVEIYDESIVSSSSGGWIKVCGECSYECLVLERSKCRVYEQTHSRP